MFYTKVVWLNLKRQMDKFNKSENQLSISELKVFEYENGVLLPEDFINHYLVNNGGFPAFNYINGENEIFTIDGFLPIKYGRLSIEKILSDLKKQNILFESKLPFANDSGGNLFFLFLNR